MLIDTHCHLTDGKFRGEVEQVIEEAKKVGVEKIIVPGTDLRDAKMVIALTKEYEKVFGLLGIYPGNFRKGEIGEAVKKLKKMIGESPKIVGIGEIGLDTYWSNREMEREKEVFRAQLELAVEMGMPVAIHTRKTEVEVREVMEGIERLPRGQFHCYGESEEFLKYILEKGFYVSFCGNVTYKSAENLRQLLRQVPLNRLLLETDAPYLPPEPLRGSRNVPANVRISGEYIARCLEIPAEKLFEETSKNAEELYKLN